jgi:hypothetical protein
MSLIPLIIYAAELALVAIILFYVVELLPMPANMKRVCQGLIILVAILSVLERTPIASSPLQSGSLNPSNSSSPSGASRNR